MLCIGRQWISPSVQRRDSRAKLTASEIQCVTITQAVIRQSHGQFLVGIRFHCVQSKKVGHISLIATVHDWYEVDVFIVSQTGKENLDLWLVAVSISYAQCLRLIGLAFVNTLKSKYITKW